jgi:hypothetical protein
MLVALKTSQPSFPFNPASVVRQRTISIETRRSPGADFSFASRGTAPAIKTGGAGEIAAPQTAGFTSTRPPPWCASCITKALVAERKAGEGSQCH